MRPQDGGDSGAGSENGGHNNNPVMSLLPVMNQFHSQLMFKKLSKVSADLPESHHVSADLPESHHVRWSARVSSITAEQPESCHVLSVTPRYSRYPNLVCSVRDAPMVSARAAGIPKPAHFNPPVPALIPLSEALPMMGIAFCCVWAAYTTSELPQVMAPAAASPEVAAHAAEPPEAAVLASAPCMVVAPSNVLSAPFLMLPL